MSKSAFSSRQGGGEFRFGRAALGSGVTIHYAQRGEGVGPPLVFLHGYGDSWRSFTGVFEFLSKTRRLVAPDLRGHGDSDKPPSGYVLADYARDLLLLLDSLGLEKIDLVGHSMGSLIAQLFAAIFPERVGRLALMSSAPALTAKTSLLELKPHIDALEDPISRKFAVEFQATTNPVAADFMEMIVAETMKVPAHVWRSVLSGLLEVDNRGILRDICASTLLLWGNQDQLFTRPDQEALLSQIAGSRLEEFDAGHSPHWEKPEEIAQALERFFG